MWSIVVESRGVGKANGSPLCRRTLKHACMSVTLHGIQGSSLPGLARPKEQMDPIRSPTRRLLEAIGFGVLWFSGPLGP